MIIGEDSVACHLGHLNLPDNAIAAVRFHLVVGQEGQLVEVQHLTQVRPILIAFDLLSQSPIYILAHDEYYC